MNGDMRSPPVTRRNLLRVACFGGIGLAAASAARSQGVCLDMAALPATQKSMRKALAFQERSSDPKRQCAGCSFFTAKGSACGSCALLSGGAVNPTSVCSSWAAKG